MILSTLQGIIGVVLAFSVAIFVHELGHFMFAKLFGVKVDTFSLGFGKKLLVWRRGETEYCISAIPFGGYVKMVGTLSKEMEDVLEGKQAATPEELDKTVTAAEELSAPAPVGLAEGIQDEVNALRNKAYWQKFLVFSAGCINNVLTAILIYFLMAWIGYYAPAPAEAVVGRLDFVSQTASPLKPNDRVVSVGGEKVDDYIDFVNWFGKKEKASEFKGPVPVELVRGGTTITEEIPLIPPVEPALPAGEIKKVAGEAVDSPEDARDRALALLDKDATGPVEMVLALAGGGTTTVKTSPIAAVGPWWPALSVIPNAPARIELLLPNLPAEKSGLEIGDLIVSIEGQPVTSSQEATSILRSMPGKVAKVVVQRETRKKDQPTTMPINLEVRANPDNPAIGQIGVMFSAQRTELIKKPFVEALTSAFKQAWNMVKAYGNALKKILGSSFQTIRENLSGPVGISVQFFKMAQSGWTNFLITFAMFNIVLALTNLLPLPVLDGGHILFATIESITGRPLPAKVMVGIYNVFTIVIIGLALLITFNDLIMNSWRVIGK
jgi:regulator of sigma E protease